MKRFIYAVCIGLSLLLTSCNGDSFTSTIVVKNNSQRSYYYSITCIDINYDNSGTIWKGTSVKAKVKSGYTYNVSTYDMISWVLLHSSNYVNAKPDKTYTITINN